MINQSLIYQELNLLPIWKLKKEEIPKDQNIFNVCKVFFNNKPLIFISLIRHEKINEEQKLFSNIMTYIKSIANESGDIKEGNEDVIKDEMSSMKEANIFFIAKDDFNFSKDFNLPEHKGFFSSNSSLTDLVGNLNKKKKLWQDIQDLIKSIN